MTYDGGLTDPVELARLRAAACDHFSLDSRRLPVVGVSALVFGGLSMAWGLSSALALATGLWCGYCAAFIGVNAISRLDRLWEHLSLLVACLLAILLLGAAVGRATEAAIWHLQELTWTEQAARIGWHLAFVAAWIAIPMIQSLAAARRLARSEAARAQATARLLALQAQIEPHFLFNTLAALRSLIRRDGAAAAELLDRTTEFLRAVLPEARQTQSTLAREVAIVDSFLAIMKARLGDRLRYSLDIDPSSHRALMPPLLLQPLVENAVKHGIEPSELGGAVELLARIGNGVLTVEVRNTGDGLIADQAQHERDVTARVPTGLANVRDRLAALFAGDGSLSLSRDAAGATVATLQIPFVEQS